MALRYPPPNTPVATPLSIAVGASYEIGTPLTDPNLDLVVLRLKRDDTFTRARAIAANDTAEYGWSKTNWATANALAAGGADEGTTVLGEMTINHGTANLDWSAGTQTGLFRWRSYQLAPGERIEVVSRIANNGDADFEFGYITATRAAAADRKST